MATHAAPTDAPAQVGDGEGRRQITLALDAQLRGPVRRTALGGPDGGQSVVEGREHTRPI